MSNTPSPNASPHSPHQQTSSLESELEDNTCVAAVDSLLLPYPLHADSDNEQKLCQLAHLEIEDTFDISFAQSIGSLGGEDDLSASVLNDVLEPDLGIDSKELNEGVDFVSSSPCNNGGYGIDADEVKEHEPQYYQTTIVPRPALTMVALPDREGIPATVMRTILPFQDIDDRRRCESASRQRRRERARDVVRRNVQLVAADSMRQVRAELRALIMEAEAQTCNKRRRNN
jgi:hypothetical protein